MRNIIIFILFLTSLTLAQRQSIVVLPSLADPESKIAPKQLDLLTEDVRTIVTKTLPTKDFNLLKQSGVGGTGRKVFEVEEWLEWRWQRSR